MLSIAVLGPLGMPGGDPFPAALGSAPSGNVIPVPESSVNDSHAAKPAQLFCTPWEYHI